MSDLGKHWPPCERADDDPQPVGEVVDLTDVFRRSILIAKLKEVRNRIMRNPFNTNHRAADAVVVQQAIDQIEKDTQR